MREQHPSSSPLQTSVSGLAYSAAAMMVLFLIPSIIRWFRGSVEDYLAPEIGVLLAQWGAWLFVILAVVFAFFLLTTALQFLVRLVFRASSRRSGGF